MSEQDAGTAVKTGCTFMFIAGEDSGDQHAARVIRHMRELQPDAKFFGYGGRRMEAAGMELITNLAQELPIIGMTQVLRNLPRIRQLLREAGNLLRDRKPDCLVLVDYPGFNLRTAKVARDLGIPVVYYISPQVWAWHKSRLQVIADNVSRMLVILPFEEDIYRTAGVPSVYVGHPLLDDETPITPAGEVRRRHGIPPDNRLIGLIPGSRNSEVTRHLPVLLESARLIFKKLPGVSFILPRASTIERAVLQKYLDRFPDLTVKIAEEDLKSVRAAMDFAICKSGTSTLELAILGVPMVIIYKVSGLTSLVARMVLKIPFIGLVNIVAGREVAPELLQEHARPNLIAQRVIQILQDPEALARMKEDLAEVNETLGGSGASRRAAEEVIDVTCRGGDRLQ